MYVQIIWENPMIGILQRRSKYGAKRPKAGQAAAPAKGKGKK